MGGYVSVAVKLSFNRQFSPQKGGNIFLHTLTKSQMIQPISSTVSESTKVKERLMVVFQTEYKDFLSSRYHFT